MFDTSQLLLAGPGLIGLCRNCGAGHGEEQQDACDLGCHGTSLACFYAVEANQYFGRSISEVVDDVLVMKTFARSTFVGEQIVFCLLMTTEPF